MNSCGGPIAIDKTPVMDWDIRIDWAYAEYQLGDDTIVTSEWAYQGNDQALTLHSDSITLDGKATIIWTAGGTLGVSYIITNTVTTAQGRLLQESFILRIVNNLYLQ